MSQSVQQRISKLRQELNHHNHLYYVQAQPSISDREYDRMMTELSELEAAHPELMSEDSPTQRIGGEPIAGFSTVRHALPMMSIDNTYDEESVRAFDVRMRKLLGVQPRYVLEPKVDGNAASVRYENGVLQVVATRGDGRQGDDITAQARTIHAIPLRLLVSKEMPIPRVLEVRGEIYMPNSVFQRINAEREAAGEERFMNPRNLTAGALKQLDPKITASRRLSFVSHGLGEVDELATDSYWQSLQLLREWGLPVSDHVKIVDDIDAAIVEIDAFARVRGKLPFQTDGMVVKVDSLPQREKAGYTSKAPRWVIAFKYAAEQVQTVLKSVDWNVGKGGTLTPVARLEPVFIGGVTVSNATLHNVDQIKKLDLHTGDTVVVERAGEVIPYVRQAVPEKRAPGAKPVEPPHKCPDCGSPVEKDAGTPYIYCPNPDCPAQLRERVKWFCGRGQMDIENVGEAMVDQLVDHGLVKNFADLFRLTHRQLLTLKGIKDKSAKNVIDAIAASRKRGLERLLAGLGIHHVGTRVAYVLASHFGSLDGLAGATVEELSAVHEIGPAIAQSVFDFFHNPAGRHVVADLQSVGVNPTMEVVKGSGHTADGSLPFANQTIVVTGTLARFTRPQIEEMITKLGGRVSGSVSKKTSFLLAGADGGSKLDKAQSLGVPVLSEADFLARAGV